MVPVPVVLWLRLWSCLAIQPENDAFTLLTQVRRCLAGGGGLWNLDSSERTFKYSKCQLSEAEDL